MRRLLLFAVVAGCALVAGWRLAPTLAASLQYPAGWNLVSGPDGSQLVGASGSLYTLQPGDTTYESFPATSTLRGGWGYWAYFPSGGSLTPGTGQASYSVTPGAGSYVMLGDPSADSAATVTGAVQLLTYDPATGYHSSSTIAAGQGAFLLAGGAVSLSATVAPAAALPAATASAAAATPTATPTAAALVLPDVAKTPDGLYSLGLQTSDIQSGYKTIDIAIRLESDPTFVAGVRRDWLNLSANVQFALFRERLLSFTVFHPRLSDIASELLSDDGTSSAVSLPVASIGDETLLFYSPISLSDSPSGSMLYAYTIFFRRGPVIVQLTTAETQPNGSSSFLESLARTVSGRLAAAGVPSNP